MDRPAGYMQRLTDFLPHRFDSSVFIARASGHKHIYRKVGKTEQERPFAPQGHLATATPGSSTLTPSHQTNKHACTRLVTEFIRVDLGTGKSKHVHCMHASGQ